MRLGTVIKSREGTPAVVEDGRADALGLVEPGVERQRNGQWALTMSIHAGGEGEARVIVPASVLLRCIGMPGLMYVSFILIAIPISDQGGYLSFPGHMLALAVVGTALVGGFTARIEVVGDELRLVDWMTVRTVDRGRVDHVDGRNGVVVVTRGGQRLESVAYGRSVWQGFFPSRRCARAAGRIQQWADCSSQPAIAPPMVPTGASSRHAAAHNLRSEGIVRRPRRLLARGFPAALVVTQILGVVLWWASPVLYPIVTWH